MLILSVFFQPVNPHEGLNKTANVEPETDEPIEVEINITDLKPNEIANFDPESDEPIDIETNVRRNARKLANVEPENVKPVDVNSHEELNKTAKF